MLYRRRFKEELSNLDKDYLKSTVVGYLYNKDKSSIKKAKEFIVKLQNGNPDEIDIYIKNLIKMLPKPQVVYKRNKKKFDNFFQIIKDIVGENYSNLYELYKKNRIKKFKNEIKQYFDFVDESNISLDFMQDAYNVWYNSLISGSSVITKVNGYTIPFEVAKYCNITKNVKDIEDWKVRVRVGNSGGKKGDWDDIGYLAISADSILIPIARSDEHRMGYEYLLFLKKKGIVKDPTKFLTIFPRDITFFHLGYDKDQEEQDLLNNNIETLKLWLKNTGWNIKLKSMAGTWEGNAVKFIKTFDGLSISDAHDIDYNRKKVIIKKQKELSDTGKKVIKYFEEIWERIKKNNDLVFNSVYALLRILKPYLDNNTYMKFFEKTV